MTLILSRLIRQMLAIVLEMNSKGLYQIKVQEKKERVVVLCLVLSRCSRTTTAKKCTKKRDARAKLLFC